MNKHFLMSSLFLLFSSSCFFQDVEAAEFQLYLVRHAEKEAGHSDPALSKKGVSRAKLLASILSDANIEKIYSTDYQRTRLTAKPLARLLDKPVEMYDPKNPTHLVNTVLQHKHNALIVGHSNTVPQLVTLLGGDAGKAIDETEYNRLYQLTIDDQNHVKTRLLPYRLHSSDNRSIAMRTSQIAE